MFELEGHVADVRVRLRSATLEELFVDGMRGLYAVMHATPADGALRVTQQVALDAGDATYLLVDFLNEVLASAHGERRLFTAARFSRLTETELDAELEGVAPAVLAEDVKAVTYHEAEVRRDADGAWSTVIVLDI